MSTLKRFQQIVRPSTIEFVMACCFFIASPLHICAQVITSSPVVFEEVTLKSGINWVHNNGHSADRHLPETVGSGCAFFDYDNDGWMDIFLVNSGPSDFFTPSTPLKNALFHNNRNGTFSDVTEKSGVASGGFGMGVAAADYDGDGWIDLYVTYYGKNFLYHNNGNGTFSDVSEKAHVAGGGKSWGTGCAFVDYDRDGKLDLMVANYVDFDSATAFAPGERPSCIWKGVAVMCGPRGLPWAKNILYHNLGNGTFEDVTTK